MRIDLRIKQGLFVLAAIGIVMGGAGCIPKRVFWSPDGQQAVVITEEDSYLCDKDGKLSAPQQWAIRQVAWFADSKRVLVSRIEKIGTWEAAKIGLSESRQKELVALAEPVRQEILTHEGSWDKWKPKSFAELTGGEQAALWLYVRDQHGKELQEKLGTTKWNECRDLKMELNIVQLYTASEGILKAGPIFLNSVDRVASLRISPDDKKIVCATDMTGGSCRLMIAEAAASCEWHKVVEGAACYPDWSADGRSLVYARTATRSVERDANQLDLGALARKMVCSEEGRLLAPIGEEEVLAGILFNAFMKIQCLRDGRVLFAAAPLQLPCTGRDMPPKASIFVVNPDRQPTVTRLLTHDAEINAPNEGLQVGVFEVSPDEKRVTMLDWQKGQLAVYTLATGDVKELLPTDPAGKKLGLVPVWRTNDELCFAARPGSQGNTSKRTEIMLYSVSTCKSRCLSKDWPDSVLEKVLSVK